MYKIHYLKENHKTKSANKRYVISPRRDRLDNKYTLTVQIVLKILITTNKLDLHRITV